MKKKRYPSIYELEKKIKLEIRAVHKTYARKVYFLLKSTTVCLSFSAISEKREGRREL